MCCCGSAVHVHSKLWRAAWPLVTTPTPCSSLPLMPTSLAPSPSPSTRAVRSWPGPCLAPRTTCLASPLASPQRRSAKAHLMLNFVHHICVGQHRLSLFMLRVLRQQAALCISRPSLRSLSAASCNVAPLCTRGLSFRSIATTAAYTMASQAPTTADAASATAAATAAAAAKTASTAASSATRRDLWPAIEPYNTGFLKVSDVHTVHRSM